MKISFDFDGTLEFKEVQNYAKSLINRGYHVCILTTRFSDPSNYNFDATEDFRYMYKVAHDLEISEIYFTEYEDKYLHIDKYDIDLHLDDNYRDEVYVINKCCKARAVLYQPGWKNEFENAIEIIEDK
jgi:hypothetical protein